MLYYSYNYKNVKFFNIRGKSPIKIIPLKYGIMIPHTRAGG